MAYVVGKLTYIFGENCSRKFLDKVCLEKKKRKNCIIYCFQAPDSDITTQIKLKKGLENDGLSSWPSVEERNLGFADILEDFDFSRISAVDKSIMEDCNSTAFWRYSLPVSIISSGVIYTAIKAELLNASKRATTFPRLPKMMVGGSLGYIAGQWLYVYSRDCTHRFQTFAPEGEIAMLLRGEFVCKDCLSEGETDEGEDYVMPSEGGEEIDQIIKDQCDF